MCQNCDKIEAKKQSVIAEVEKTPRCCLVCESPDAVAIGTWTAGKEHRLAVGDRGNVVSVFGFWLCEEHMAITPANEKLITQMIVQESSRGRSKEV